AGSVFLSQWYIYCVSIILTSLSFGISVIMSKIFRLNSKKTRAICMNTALPNIPLAITIIQVYINPCCSQILSAFPLFHTFWMLIETIIIGKISNSTVGLIRKDPNDPNIEYLDEVTSIGDDESLVLDNNLSNLIIPTTTFTRGSYTIYNYYYMICIIIITENYK
ncbi:hypothetical protein H8356DRAFT_1091457, partial [Neocallimastix lanati (nom. inval.)]